MGWTWKYASAYKENGKVDQKAECDKLFTKEFTVLKSCMKGNVYYAAVKKTAEDGTKIVFAAVILTSLRNISGMNFGYKEMEESMGPVETKCPTSILNLLTKTKSEFALSWREQCRNYNENEKEKRRKRKILSDAVDGTKIRFVTNFSDKFGVFKKGDLIKAVKIHTGGLERWFDGIYSWRTAQIPENYTLEK